MKRIVHGFLIAGLLIFLGFSSTGAQSVSELQAQLNALLQQVAELQSQLQNSQNTAATSSSGGSTASSVSSQCSFSRSLFVGVLGNDVLCLQRYLNISGFSIAASGPGSVGNETTYFGSLTRTAVSRWQQVNGVSPAVGYFGPVSQSKYIEVTAGMLLDASPTTEPVVVSAPPVIDTPSVSPPVIHSITPSSGPPGTVVTIRGENFHPTANTIIVEYAEIFAFSPDGKTLTFTFLPPDVEGSIEITEPVTFQGIYLEGFQAEEFDVSANPTQEEVVAILEGMGLGDPNASPKSPDQGVEYGIYVQNEFGEVGPSFFYGELNDL